MGNAVQQIRAHVLDMLASTERLNAFIAAQLASPQPAAGSAGAYVLQRANALLETHTADLREHVTRLGGAANASPVADRAPARALDAGKALGDLFSRLSFVNAAALMLETNARALGFSSTAALASQHREEMTVLLAQLREMLPQAA